MVVAIVPIFRGDEERATVAAFIDKLLAQLCGGRGAARRACSGDGIESFTWDRRVTHQQIVVDWRDNRPGDKQYHWEQRGVPFRIEVGPRDVDGGRVRAEEAARSQRRRRCRSADASRAWLRRSARPDAARHARAGARAFRDAQHARAPTATTS